MTVTNGATIQVEVVSKWYGSVVAVNDVSFEVYPGITGLLGPNGAGKTTLLHMMSGLAKVSKGDVRVLGQPPRGGHDLYRRIGVMSEHEAVYTFLTGRELVEMAARLQGVEDLRASVDWAIDTVNLADAQHRTLGTYSRGMRQRMRLAAAMVHDPEVLILDEPLNGTDPRQRLEFEALMRVLAARGRTILISSHILEEVETLSTKTLLLVSGKLAATGDYRAIRRKLDDRPFKLRVVSEDPRKLAAALVQIPAVDSVSVEADGSIVLLTSNVGELQATIAKLARDAAVRLYRVEPLDDSLESVFSYVGER